jgi:mRNA interferase RelE/StbE
MAWSLELSPTAQRQLADLDKPVSKRILSFLYDRVIKLDDPRQLGERLHGTLSEFWRYRVGDYRIVCSIEHERLLVIVLRIGHRRDIYNR